MSRERIAVAGGGVAGLRTAMQLVKNGYPDVVVIEKQPNRSRRSWFSIKDRLPSDVVHQLQTHTEGKYQLNGTEFVLFDEENRIRERVGIDIGANLAPDTNLMVQQKVLEAKLLEDAQTAGVKILHDSILTAAQNNHTFDLELKRGKNVAADIVVDATGPGSQLQRELSLLTDDPIVMWMYGARMEGNFDPTKMIFPLTHKTGKVSWVTPWSQTEADVIAADYCKESEYRSRLPEFKQKYELFVELCKKSGLCEPTRKINSIVGRIRVVPIQKPKYQHKVFAVGEAAGQTCPYMSEGVSSALKQADNLAQKLQANPQYTPAQYHDSWYKDKHSREYDFPMALALLMKRVLRQEAGGNIDVYKAVIRHGAPEDKLRWLTERTIKPKDLPILLAEASIHPSILVQVLDTLHKRLLLGLTSEYDGYLWGKNKLPF